MASVRLVLKITFRRDMFDLMITIRIREMAERRGMKTAYQLMRAADVHPAVATRWWTNNLYRMDISTINKLCNVLECKPNDILVFTPDKKSKATSK